MKKAINHMLQYYHRLTSHKYVNKYTITLAIFFIWLALFDSNSLLKRFKVMRQQQTVDSQIEEYNNNIRQNQELIDVLGSSTDNLEQFAREHYHMKKANEEIFIIKE